LSAGAVHVDAAAHSRPVTAAARAARPPAWPGCPTSARELICSAARTCSNAPSPPPDQALLLARPSAAIAAFWLVWPLTTATGPCSGSAGSASTTNQRDRPRERTATGAPPTGAGTPDASAAAPPAASCVAVSFAATTCSAMRPGAGATEAEGPGGVPLPSAR